MRLMRNILEYREDYITAEELEKLLKEKLDEETKKGA